MSMAPMDVSRPVDDLQGVGPAASSGAPADESPGHAWAGAGRDWRRRGRRTCAHWPPRLWRPATSTLAPTVSARMRNSTKRRNERSKKTPRFAKAIKKMTTRMSARRAISSGRAARERKGAVIVVRKAKKAGRWPPKTPIEQTATPPATSMQSASAGKLTFEIRPNDVQPQAIPSRQAIPAKARPQPRQCRSRATSARRQRFSNTWAHDRTTRKSRRRSWRSTVRHSQAEPGSRPERRPPRPLWILRCRRIGKWIRPLPPRSHRRPTADGDTTQSWRSLV